MNVIILRGISKIKKFKIPVVALGVFDGVHLGHRKILKDAVTKAKSIKGTSVVLTFWPHPHRDESLYSLEHRLSLIQELGINVSVVVNFNKHFTRISAADFIENILAEKIGARYVYVGENFRFGRNAEGNVLTLQDAAEIYGFRLKIFSVVSIKNKPISSTLIRSLIKKGDLKAAQKLLGRPVSILGTVIRGVSFGKKLGFPTANIDPHHEVIPARGIYAVKVYLCGERFIGACYIGSKPTFLKRRSSSIEVHILNFRKKIYGKDLEIQFSKKIRDDKKFKTSEDLSRQIQKDVLATKAHFSLH
ncbi:MAG: riboflavin biosynthesis protein RibF [Omnitrophica WOR_2 bacterium RBG_13_44_8b]|nr:MAG: riboflavin biosynthesis protein RibF [Omnitrophica WOR_2 bacterium RBG_13_44_8b]